MHRTDHVIAPAPAAGMHAQAAAASSSFTLPRRTCHPPACALNPTCTVAVVSTTVGVRAFALLQDDTAATHPVVHSPLAQLLSSCASDQLCGDDTTAAASAASSSSALWSTPVYTATVAGESALIAVVFRSRPPVFVPATHTMAHVDEMGEAEPGWKAAGGRNMSGDVGDESGGADAGVPTRVTPASTEAAEAAPPSPLLSAAPSPSQELFASEAEYRRYVYLFDAQTGVCLAALHFCGSPVLALRANAAVLLVAAVDLFHVVELRSLRYVRQHSMYRPLNPRAIMDLSGAVPVITKPPPQRLASTVAASPASPPSPTVSGTYRHVVAFPQSARGYRGDVTVLTLHTAIVLHTQLSNAPRELGGDSRDERASVPLPMQQRTIPAHHHAVSHLRLRPDGQLLVTASQLGTTVKLFDCATGVLLTELQRGHRPTAVLSLAVQSDGHRVAALSANGTLHLFHCTAVMQAWEVRRQSGMPESAATATASSALAFSGLQKGRADVKLRVPPLAPHRDATSAAGLLPKQHRKETVAGHFLSDGSVQYDVGFTPDGGAAWVVQMESTDTQITAERGAAFVSRSLPSTSAVSSTRNRDHPTRCVGKLTRFQLKLPSGKGNAQMSESASFLVQA